jgi:hypothetical protein
MDTIKSTKQWEGITHRPYLGEEWKCLEQQSQVRYSGTSFVRWGKQHHNGEPVSFWIVFNEFNVNHWSNHNLGYAYTVRGSVNTKPELGLKYFHTLKEATDFMVYIAEEQGRDDVELTDEVINRLFGDEDTMQFLINSKLPDIRNDLYSIYNHCYTGILVDEWYESLWNELEGFAIDSIEGREDYTYQKDAWDKDGNRIKKTYYGVRYPVTKCLHDVAVEYLVANKNHTYSDNTFEYWGSYMGILKAVVSDGDRDSLRVPRLDDWPDSRKVSKCVNENIGDYF